MSDLRIKRPDLAATSPRKLAGLTPHHGIPPGRSRAPDAGDVR